MIKSKTVKPQTKAAKIKISNPITATQQIKTEERVADLCGIARAQTYVTTERDEKTREQIVMDLIWDIDKKAPLYPKNKIKKRVTEELVGKIDPKTKTKSRISHHIIRKIFSFKEFSAFKQISQAKRIKKKNPVSVTEPSPTENNINRESMPAIAAEPQAKEPLISIRLQPENTSPTPAPQHQDNQTQHTQQDYEDRAMAVTIQRCNWMDWLLDEITGMDEAARIVFVKNLPKGKMANRELAEKSHDSMIRIAKQMSDAGLNSVLSRVQLLEHIWPKYETVLHDEYERRKDQPSV